MPSRNARYAGCPAEYAVVAVAELGVRGTQLRRVDEVEGLEPELHRALLAELEALVCREVPLRTSRNSQDALSGSTERQRPVRHKGS